MTAGRRTFLPVAALGVAGAALAAVAGGRAWVAGDTEGPANAGVALLTRASGTGEMPLASAVGLVLLAAWGVLLVTRGVARRACAALAAVASTALLTTVVVGVASLPGQVADAIREAGATQVTTSLTGWFWAAAVAGLASLTAAVLAVVWAPDWPEMGRRYDAPGTAGETSPSRGEPTSQDLWRSMDEGHDPTT